MTVAVAPSATEITDTLAIYGKAETIKEIVWLPAAGVSVAF